MVQSTQPNELHRHWLDPHGVEWRGDCSDSTCSNRESISTEVISCSTSTTITAPFVPVRETAHCGDCDNIPAFDAFRLPFNTHICRDHCQSHELEASYRHPSRQQVSNIVTKRLYYRSWNWNSLFVVWWIAMHHVVFRLVMIYPNMVSVAHHHESRCPRLSQDNNHHHDVLLVYGLSHLESNTSHQ